MPKYNSTVRLEDYAPVADRIELFYQQHPAGRITTKLISRENRETIVKAFVYRGAEDQLPAATGYAAEREGDGEINTVACLENTETSAVGRALANLGLTASKKRPSREEMQKAEKARANIARSRPVAIRSEPAPAARGLIMTDFLDVLARAERKGFGRVRSSVVREYVAHYPSPPVSPERLVKIEAGIRYWLRRRSV
jgi:hypothetical protein